MPKTNEAGLKLVENFEGLRLQAYDDGTGVWTIGYGHTPAHPGQVITEAEAEQLLRSDLAKAEEAVADLVHVELNPNQFAALVSFTFNVGAGAFSGCSVLRHVNGREWQAAADALLSWDDRGYPEQAGLDRRRQAERHLFLTDLPR